MQKIQQSKTLDEVAEALNYVDLDALYAAIGENHVSAKSVAERVRKLPRRTSTRPARSSCPITVREPGRTGAATARARPACTSRASTT